MPGGVASHLSAACPLVERFGAQIHDSIPLFVRFVDVPNVIMVSSNLTVHPLTNLYPRGQIGIAEK